MKHLFFIQRMKAALPKLVKVVSFRSAKQDFLTFAGKAIREEAGRKESTKRNLMTTVNHLRRFSPGITAEDLTTEFVEKFRSHLLYIGLCENTVGKHLRNLSTLTNCAVRHGQADAGKNPFNRFKIRQIKINKQFLAEQEVRRLEHLKLKGKDRKVLDAYLFCCYTGLRFSDFVRLKDAAVRKAENGIEWLFICTQKTGAEISVPLSLLFDAKALCMLEGKPLPDFSDIGSNGRVNMRLKRIMEKAGIKKRITFHTSRHTFATLLLQQGIAITTIQNLLGHASVKTTQIYAKVTKEAIANDFKLNAKRKPKQRIAA